MTAKEVMWLLAKRGSSPFFARRQLAVVPNVSWAMLPWEADLLVLSPSGYLTEVEIKVSLSDWKADFSKKKFGVHQDWAQAAMIKQFYYAAPKALAVRYGELALPTWAGVVSVDDSGVSVLKPAETRPGHRKLTEKEQTRLLRLAAIKAWGLFHRPEVSA
jgi:hypothetical protein